MSRAKKAGKKREAAKREIPAPGKESRPVFSAALAIAKGLLESNGLRIDLDENGNVELTLDALKLEAIGKDKFQEGLTAPHFLSLIRTEIESLVKVATYSDATQGVQEEIPSKVVNEVGVDEFLWRLEQVEKQLVPPNLRERAMFRRTAQGLVLQGVSWQVISKKYDGGRGKLSDIPCASVSIIYGSPRTNRPSVRFVAEEMAIQLPTIREPNHLILELDQDDVQKLIESLTHLRENLDRVRKGR